MSETAWPALLAALRRAENSGCDPAVTLSSAVAARELRTARSISEVLAWRIGHRSATASASSIAPVSPSETSAPTPDQRATIPCAALPPWLTGPVPTTGGESASLSAYLNDAAELIATRVSDLVDAAVRHRPPWMNLLGLQPDDPDRAREWLRHIGIIAAYRDQYKVTSDDPQQVLGPYTEPGHAGHSAYWHAAESVLTARRLADLEPASAAASEDGRPLAQLARTHDHHGRIRPSPARAPRASPRS